MTSYILYKADDVDDHGWEERMLVPYGGFTDILAQEIDYGEHELPEVGDRMREYINTRDSDDGKMYGRDGDWIVQRVEIFSSDSGSGDRVVICYCDFQPVTPEWEEIPEGAPVEELLAAK